MTKSTIGVLAISCAAISAPALARDTAARGGFELGAEIYDYSYRERFEGATVVRDDGTFGAFTANYVETLSRGWLLKARLTLGWGSVDYASNAGSRLRNVPQNMGQLELLVGRDFAVGDATVTPFAGLAARVLNDHSGGKTSSDGLMGYDREVGYGYVPIGAAVRMPAGGGRALALSGQINFVANGDVRSRFSDAGPELPDVKVDLQGGKGWELSAAFEMPAGQRRLSVGPFARSWRIDRSESLVFVEPEGTIELFEPKNRTWEVGLRLGFAF